MAVTIKHKEAEPKPPVPGIADLPRKGMHLRASPWERQRANGYSGTASAPLCNTGNGHAESTFLSRKVTCPCCLAHIVDRLFLPEYLTVQQWAIIGRPAMPGAPDADKGEAYPKSLPERDAYGRADKPMPAGAPKAAREPTGSAQKAKSSDEGQDPPKNRKATPAPTPSIYDDF